MSVQSLVLSGPLLLAIPVAAAAGAVTFLSPCVLPLVPGYLSYITGMSGAGVGTGADAAMAATDSESEEQAQRAEGSQAAGAGATAVKTLPRTIARPGRPRRSRVL